MPEVEKFKVGKSDFMLLFHVTLAKCEVTLQGCEKIVVGLFKKAIEFYSIIPIC